MPNGTGLKGNFSSTQSALIIKQPGSTNLYYIFTVDAIENSSSNGLQYSIVDMSMAAGNGAVTAIKNVPLQTPSSEQLTAVRHCNNVDVWIVSHDVNSNNFRTFLLSASGLSAPVVSAAGFIQLGAAFGGYLKSSPDGTKLGMTSNNANRPVELFDFNRSTGLVSNPVTLFSSSLSYRYGCEFSPDGTKFYAGSTYTGELRQWNLSAGSNAAIIASGNLIGVTPSLYIWALQLGSDGKIYVRTAEIPFSAVINYSLSVINNPNTLGSGCGVVYNAVSIFPRSVGIGLPNFPASIYFPSPIIPPPVVTNTNTIASTGCNCSGSFTLNLPGSSIPPFNYRYSNGAQTLNTAAFSNSLSNLCPGVYGYTATSTCDIFVGNFTIGLGSNTISVTSSVTPANCASVTGSVTITSVVGAPATYTITEGATIIASGINVPFNIPGVSVGNHFYTLTSSNGGCAAFSANVWTETVTVTPTVNLFCNSNTATLSAFSNNALATYTWSGPGIVSGINSTNPVVNQAGTYTVGVTYGSCTSFSLVTVTQNTTVPISVSTNSLTCVNLNETLTAVSAGNTLVWNGGSFINATNPVTVSAVGNYTVTATNTITGCSSSSVVSVGQDNTVPTLTITVTNFFGLPTSTTLTCLNSFIFVTALPGFSSNVSINGGGNSVSTVSPITYTATSTHNISGCKTTSVITISQNITPPSRGASVSNSITCVNPTATLTGISSTPGVTYSWSPLGLTTAIGITTVAGNHTLTVTDPVNSCKSTTVVTVLQGAGIPTITASANRTLTCINTSATLTAVSTVTNIVWNGGALINATNPATVNVAGAYIATATNTLGCPGSTVVNVFQNTTGPFITIFTLPILTCLNPSIRIGTWILGNPVTNGPGLVSAPSTSFITIPGTYTASATNTLTGCSTFSVFTVNGSKTNDADASLSNTLSCANPTVLLTGTSSSTVGINVYTWFPGGINTNTLSVNAPGNYTLQVTNSLNGCPPATTVITVPGSLNSLTLTSSITNADCGSPTGTVSINIAGGAPNYTITEGGITLAVVATSPYDVIGVSLGSHT
ncbi:MAG: beta strand repeat-containing protein [Bacteroidota bacterium]